MAVPWCPHLAAGHGEIKAPFRSCAGGELGFCWQTRRVQCGKPPALQSQQQSTEHGRVLRKQKMRDRLWHKGGQPE